MRFGGGLIFGRTFFEGGVGGLLSEFYGIIIWLLIWDHFSHLRILFLSTLYSFMMGTSVNHFSYILTLAGLKLTYCTFKFARETCFNKGNRTFG